MDFEYSAQLPDDSRETFEKLIEEIKKYNPEAFKEMKDGEVEVSAFNPNEYFRLKSCIKQLSDMLQIDFNSFKFKFEGDAVKCWITAELDMNEILFTNPHMIAEYVRDGFIFEFTLTTHGTIGLVVSTPYGVYQPTEDTSKFSPVYQGCVSKSIGYVVSGFERKHGCKLDNTDFESLALFLGHSAYICEFEEEAHISVDYDENDSIVLVTADVSSFTLQDISPHLTELFDMSDSVGVCANKECEEIMVMFGRRV